MTERIRISCPVCDGELQQKDDKHFICGQCGTLFEFILKQIEATTGKGQAYVTFDRALLERSAEETGGEDETEAVKAAILDTLDLYGIKDITIGEVKRGPTFTEYDLIAPMSADLDEIIESTQALPLTLRRMGVVTRLNYEDGCISVDVPNKNRRIVRLGDMPLRDPSQADAALTFPLGQDVRGKVVEGNISKMVHMLVAGATGSGKSVFLHSLILSLAYAYSPSVLRFILIDPKRTEFCDYKGLPHLVFDDIVTEPRKALRCLDWAIGEMERRYDLFAKIGEKAGKPFVNVDTYNAAVEKEARLPKLIVVIEELADLMLMVGQELEIKLMSLAQKSRAAGIHLIVATQRPTEDVLTGAIRCCMPTRIAFRVAAEEDSQLILDQTGAEELLGKGDMLYMSMGMTTPCRLQSPSVSWDETLRVVEYLKENNRACYDEAASAFIDGREE